MVLLPNLTRVLRRGLTPIAPHFPHSLIPPHLFFPLFYRDDDCISSSPSSVSCADAYLGSNGIYGKVSEYLYNFCFHYASFFRIGLSLLSERARIYVRLLKIKCNHITLKLNGDIILMTVFFDNRREEYVDMYIDKYRPVDSTTDGGPECQFQFTMPLWIKKECNPKLEYLGMETRDNVDNDLLLNGLNAVQMPIRTDRTFRVLGNVKQLGLWEKINFEFDITRVDGRTATIRISKYTKVCFYVWPKSTNDATNNEPNQSSFTRKLSRLSSFYNSCIERFK
ncbi:hypothetical protein CRE_10456 [Caenorhabditis remanei]|uniref:Uncharacterized protein n=2 Tax=Caenorhabditis remanei TaxID=31234 RepID=E3N0L6_CAERE|nr:hypothetical protein CRE_10456 [Caenorhabditis remanei]